MMVMAEILYCIFNVLGWIFTELNVYGVLVALLLVPLCVQVACMSETTLYRVLLFLFLFFPLVQIFVCASFQLVLCRIVGRPFHLIGFSIYAPNES